MPAVVMEKRVIFVLSEKPSFVSGALYLVTIPGAGSSIPVAAVARMTRRIALVGERTCTLLEFLP